MAPKRKYSELTQELAIKLYTTTTWGYKEISRFTVVPPMTLQNWFKKIKVPHRGNGRGVTPSDPVPALEEEIKALREERDSLLHKLAELGVTPTDMEEIFARGKERMFSLLATSLTLTEVAAGIRAAVCLDAHVKGQDTGVQRLYKEVQYPSGVEDISGVPGDDDNDNTELHAH